MPENWKTYKLGEIAEIQNGYAFKSGEMGDKGIPIIKIKNIIPPDVVLEGSGYYTGEINSRLEKFIIKNGDFLIAMTGSTVNVMSSAVGKMGKYRLNDIALLNQRAGKIYITDLEKADFEYVCHFLNRYEIHYNLALNATGSANQANISPAQIKDIDINLPPLQEQKAIASILSALDDKIELSLQMNKTLEEMAMALYKHWFIDFGPFKNGKFVDSELGMIPEGWEVKRVEEIADVIDSLHKTPTYSETGIPMVRVTDINGGFLNIQKTFKVSEEVYEEFSKKYKPKMGDVVMSRVGTYGVSSYVGSQDKFCLGQNTIILVPKVVASSYLFYALINQQMINQIEEQVTGSTQKTISLKSIRNLKVALPIDLISNKLSEFNEPTSAWLTLGSGFSVENQTLTTLRDTLLPKLISGAIRVKDVEEMVAASL